ncbi:hypothetical protein BY996DRAFT_6562374 [Phakopsora pachyrhizi]|nr:hypothetical protein BY996DRAFT_6562374 [Phakopsora pachyrhizi]
MEECIGLVASLQNLELGIEKTEGKTPRTEQEEQEKQTLDELNKLLRRDWVELVRVIERLKKGMKLLIEEKGSLRERISELESIRIKFEGLVEIERQEREKLQSIKGSVKENKLLKDSNRLLRLEPDKRSNQLNEQESILEELKLTKMDDNWAHGKDLIQASLDELWTSVNIKARNNGILIRTGNSVVLREIDSLKQKSRDSTRSLSVIGLEIAERLRSLKSQLLKQRPGGQMLMSTGQMEELAVVVVVAGYNQWRQDMDHRLRLELCVEQVIGAGATVKACHVPEQQEDGGDRGTEEDRAKLCELFDGIWKPGGQG